MRWIPHERPKIDRIARPWRTTRFIDPSPSFYTSPAESASVSGEKDGAPFPA